MVSDSVGHWLQSVTCYTNTDDTRFSSAVGGDNTHFYETRRR
jgi:hypothetical protein